MSGRNLEEKHFIEDIGLFFEQMGLPRMAGRILGVLLISDPPPQSTNDLCEILGASKSSINITARLLTSIGLIEKVPSPVPRRDYYQFTKDGWLQFMKQHIALWEGLHHVAEHGLQLMENKDVELQRRLQEAHDLFSFMEEEIPGIIARWRAKKNVAPLSEPKKRTLRPS